MKYRINSVDVVNENTGVLYNTTYCILQAGKTALMVADDAGVKNVLLHKLVGPCMLSFP